MKCINKGFTLIELLVVIAIIGLLSSVVMGSLNSARFRSVDTAIKATLSQIRAQSEIYYDTNKNFGTDFAAANCPTVGGTTIFVMDSVATKQIAYASAQSGVSATCAAGNGSGAPSGAIATTWAVSVPLKSAGAGNWCVSSNTGGVSGTAAIVANNAVCQ